MAATVRDLAARAGVSASTVSRYFSGSKVVSTETARKIEEAAEELGYSYQKRRYHNEKVIAVLIPNLELDFYREVIQQILQQIPKYSYQIVIVPIIGENDHYKKIFQELWIDGVIYVDENIDKDVLNYICSKHIKTVMCGGEALNHKCDMVRVNDMAAAYEGMKYLMGLGHRKILILSDCAKNISTGFQRLTGCKRALEEGRAPLQEENILYGDLSYKSGYQLIQQAIREKKEFTAVFAFCDEMALGAMAALYEHHISVPQDVSVLGFDDLEIAKRIRPQLTTVHQPIREFVKKTLDSFLDLDSQENMEIILPYEIKERGTCDICRNEKEREGAL